MEESVARNESRYRALVEAGIALGAEPSLGATLHRIIESARTLTGARYAALGVIDASGRELESFITTGIEPHERAAIGPEPRGRGILGLLIREQRPLRLRDLSEDPHSVGFPPGHPPMTSFLGVPIHDRGSAYGNLYLTDKDGHDEFTDGDEELIVLLAAQAAVAISNQRLYDSAQRWASQLESISRISDALVANARSEDLADIVAAEFKRVVGARIGGLARFDLYGDLRVVAAAGADARLLATAPISPYYADRIAAGASSRIDSLLDDPHASAAQVRELGVRSGLITPLRGAEKVLGALIACDREGSDPRFSDADARAAEIFAGRAAIVLELAGRVSRESVDAILAALEKERRRIGLELHDQTGQELTAALLALKAVARAADGGEDIGAAVSELRDILQHSLRNVRRLATELRPPALEAFGLVPAIEHLSEMLSDRGDLQITVRADIGDERLSAAVEATLYRVVQESLTNVVRHAAATSAAVTLSCDGRSVEVSVKDDGDGFDPTAAVGIGLAGMTERAALVDGRISIDSAPGRGTTVRIEVPLP